MPKNDITTKYGVDISEFKKGITEANRIIKEANSIFNVASSGMDKWEKSTEGLRAKLNQLKTVLEAQNNKLENYQKQLQTAQKYEKEATTNVENLKKALDKAKKEYGENSAEVKKLEKELSAAEKTEYSMKNQVTNLTVTMNNQQAVVNKTQLQINKYDNELKTLEAESKKAESATSELTKEIDKQELELNELKNKYKDVILKEGESSKEAISLGKQINKLSGELKENKTKLENTASAADNLDKSLKDVDTNKVTKGFTVLKGVMSDFIANGIRKVASAITGQLGAAISRVDTINSYKRTMQNLGYATEDVSETTNKLKKGIEGLPTTLPSIMSQQQQYAALSGNIEEATKLTIALNNATLAGGQGQETANGAAEQWYKIIAAGKPDLESWRIINSAMPAQMNQIATSVLGAGKKSQDLFKAWQGGKVTTQQIIDALINLDTKGGGNLASFQEQAKDATGGIDTSMANIKTAITNGLAQIIEKVGAENITNFLNSVKEGINKAIPIITTLINFIINNGPTIISVLTGIAAGFVAFKVVGLITSLIGVFQTLFVSLKMGTGIIGALNLAMNANPIAIIVMLIAGLVTAFITLWNTSEGFKNFWIGLWDKIKSAAYNAWKAITGFFNTAWETIKGVWSGVTGFFSGVWEGIKSILTPVAKWFYETVIAPIWQKVQFIIGIFTSAWTLIAQLAKGCWNLIKAVWSVVSNWFNTKIVQPVKSVFTVMWNGIKVAAQTAWNFIKGIWNAVSTWFKNKVIEPVKKVFTPMWNILKTGASNAWNGIKNVFSKVSSFFKNTFEKAWTAVKNVFSTGGKIFVGIKDGIVNAFKTVVNAIINGINKVVKIPFEGLNNTLNKLQNIDVAGVKPFSGLTWRATIPQIPQLYRGGILKKGQTGYLEGNGAEAVFPLERNKYWIKKVANELLKYFDITSISSNLKRSIGELKSSLLQLSSGFGVNKTSLVSTNGITTQSASNNFTQIINSPKALSRIEIYRQTKNLLALKGGK